VTTSAGSNNGGNFSACPLFCDPDNLNFALGDESPCLPSNNPGCGLVGAFGAGQLRSHRDRHQTSRGTRAATRPGPEPSPIRSTRSPRSAYALAGGLRPGDEKLVIVNPIGRAVRTIAIGRLGPGQQQINVVWDGRDDAGRDLPNGVYFYSLVVNGKVTESKRAVLLSSEAERASGQEAGAPGRVPALAVLPSRSSAPASPLELTDASLELTDASEEAPLHAPPATAREWRAVTFDIAAMRIHRAMGIDHTPRYGMESRCPLRCPHPPGGPALRMTCSPSPWIEIDRIETPGRPSYLARGARRCSGRARSRGQQWPSTVRSPRAKRHTTGGPENPDHTSGVSSLPRLRGSRGAPGEDMPGAGTPAKPSAPLAAAGEIPPRQGGTGT